MNEKQFFKIRLYVTGTVTLGIWALLAWNYSHGGIPSHHLLANDALPAISNGWGAILLPLLTWFLLYCIQKSMYNSKHDASQLPRIWSGKLYAFTGSLLFSILLSAFFTFGNTQLCSYMMLGLLPLAIFFPIYRPEYLLGFVLGMTFTFGAVLPTGIGMIVGVIAFVLFTTIRAGIKFTKAGFSWNKQ